MCSLLILFYFVRLSALCQSKSSVNQAITQLNYELIAPSNKTILFNWRRRLFEMPNCPHKCATPTRTHTLTLARISYISLPPSHTPLCTVGARQTKSNTNGSRAKQARKLRKNWTKLWKTIKTFTCGAANALPIYQLTNFPNLLLLLLLPFCADGVVSSLCGGKQKQNAKA